MGDSTDRVTLAYEGHHIALVRLCFLLSGDRWVAEDLAQEVFVRTNAKLKKLPEEEAGPYLRVAAINLWRSTLRRRMLERRYRPDAPVYGEPTPVEDRDEVWEQVQRLPARQRACLVLRYYEDLADSAIAELLGCSVGTVKSQSARGLAKLRRRLTSD